MSLVIKRNKKAQEFSEKKLKRSIQRAFESCKHKIDDQDLNLIVGDVNVIDGMRTEDIQKQVENILMRRGYYDEARFYIIWRHINYYNNLLSNKVKFMREYLGAVNAASGSKYDSNANVTEKNVATLSNELFKGDIIELNRYRLHEKISEMYGSELADKYIRELESHRLYKHDESSIMPYCVAVTMYRWLINGLTGIGGLSKAPKNIDSYCGGFINLAFAISSQFAGAFASPEFLMYFDYFARKAFGQDYTSHSDEFYVIGPKLRKLLNKSHYWCSNPKELSDHDFGSAELNKIRDEIVRDSTRGLTEQELKKYSENVATDPSYKIVLGDGTRTISSQIEQYFQQVVFSMNQPAAARGYQSIFWNIGYFDKYYFEGLFGEFQFPDHSTPKWNSLKWLQKKFMYWFNEERRTCVLTFPVESFSLLTDPDTKEYKDKESANFVAEMYSLGHSFFTYISDNPDALSSCCRLRNGMQDNQFSFTLGMSGVATGSKSVMTININRVIQDAVREKKNYCDEIRSMVQDIHKYQNAFNELLKEFYNQGALPVYSEGFISLNQQYLTLGINGAVEAAEFLGIQAKPTPEYKEFIQSILKIFYEENKKDRTKELMYNTEFVPAENLGIKNYDWDKRDGYVVPTNRNCYNSYFFASEDTDLSIFDKLELHGKEFVKYLDGGSACHINLDSHLSKKQYRILLDVAAEKGTNYLTFNIPNTLCNDCGHIDKRYLKECPHCGSKNVDYLTRIIGYLKRVSNFSAARQKEAGIRYYEDAKEVIK